MDSRPCVPVWEKVFAAAALCLSTAAVFPLLRAGGGVADPTQSDALTEKLWLAVYAVVVLLLLRNRVSLRSLLAANKALFAVVGLALVSVAWSDVPQLTLRRAIALVLTTTFAIYLATRFSRRELGGLIAWSLALVVAASALTAVLKPSYGLDHVRGDAWRGVFTTKNELGRIAAFALGVWLLRLLTLRGHPVVALHVCALSGLVLMRSSSRTADVAVVLVLALLLALPALRMHYSIAIPSGALLLAVAVVIGNWLVTRADAVLTSVGADATLTGRRDIWAAVWHSVAARPWLGYGYDAFWRGFDGPSAYVWAVVGSRPPHSHNGLLELWLSVGVVGVALLGAAFALALARAVRAVRAAWTFEAVFPLLVLVLVALYNVSESTLMVRNSLFWILLVAVSVQLTVRAAPEAHRIVVQHSDTARPAAATGAA
jgi:O-antigen ligase